MVKPVFDRLSAFILGICLLPIVFFISLIRVFQGFGSKLLFFQERSGHLQKKFVLVKFRTLNEAGKPDSGFAVFLRSSGLDELPQIWSIIKGEMSFVGPRPLLVEYDDLYDENQLMRFQVLPGITGLAQINESSISSWKEKFQLDFDYVKNPSFISDLGILLKTIKKALLFRASKKSNSFSEIKWEGN